MWNASQRVGVYAVGDAKNKCHDKAERAIKFPGMRAWIRSMSRWMGHTMGKGCLAFENACEVLNLVSILVLGGNGRNWRPGLVGLILADSMEQSPSSEADLFSASEEIPHILWNPKVQYRQMSLSWARSIHSIPLHPTSWRSILILSAHLRLGLRNGLFP